MPDINAPELRLLDARSAGLDEAGLRAWARAETAGSAHASRSYRFPYSLVALHSERVGVDLEVVQPFDDGFAASILTPAERERPGAETDLTAVWCSKEALAKALGDALGYDPRHLESPMYWPQAASGPWRAVAVAVPDGYRGWVCWCATGAPAQGG